MNNTLSTFFDRLKRFPLWIRVIVVVLIAALVLVLSLTSCGPTVKVSARSTDEVVTISVSQNVSDSTGVSIAVHPTINIK